MKKWQYILIIGLLIFLLGGVLGWTTRKSTHHCPVITPDTTIVVDPVTHTIVDYVPYYIVKKITVIKYDTTFLPADTAAILRDYFSVKVYDRTWRDSLLLVDVSDTITQNRPIGNSFRYKILRPQTLVINEIDNSKTYHSYITGGVDIPIKNFNYIEIEANYVGPKGYVGIGWMPEMGGINIKGGMTFIKFKKTK